MNALTSLHIRNAKGQRKLAMLTAYDSGSADLLDSAGVDMILVGDSLGMVVMGRPDTLSVRLEEVLHHCRAVCSAPRRALVVADLPFMSYEAGPQQALESAGRIFQAGGARAVKLEGGREVLPQVRALVQAGIPVMAHVGLTPQRVAALGGFRTQGKSAQSAAQLVQDARALEEAGCFAVLLECVPWELAARVTGELAVPTIGIGAGAECDGQVLVFHDAMGMFPGQPLRFVKRFADLHPIMLEAAKAYVAEVRAGAFPASGHCVSMPEEEHEEFIRLYGERLPL
ncbi:MAG: 3-methyl-2-oxobutanoate hydroxymethyltransferase [Deltaproteobacteria bacterium]|nr:3-methyl-2-oxobutanoate hydroxymethyltransferase [Deltaproteobacteria bacterium]